MPIRGIDFNFNRAKTALPTSHPYRLRRSYIACVLLLFSSLNKVVHPPPPPTLHIISKTLHKMVPAVTTVLSSLCSYFSPFQTTDPVRAIFFVESRTLTVQVILADSTVAETSGL